MRYAAFAQLHTPRLRLRKLTEEDLGAYFRLFGSAEVARYMLWEPHREISQSAAALQRALERYETGRYYRWAIEETISREMIGILEFLHFDREAETCSFAYMLAEPFQGLGYGTEALHAAVSFAFEKMEVSAIQADHFATNSASGAVMRKVGMEQVGVIPQKYEKQGILYDAVQYRITREQWDKKTRC